MKRSYANKITVLASCGSALLCLLASLAVSNLLFAFSEPMPVHTDDMNKLEATGNCPGCDLTRGDFPFWVGLEFGGATLNDADLTEANMRKVNLSGANLREASLTTTNLTEANLSETDTTDTDFTGAKGLKK